MNKPLSFEDQMKQAGATQIMPAKVEDIPVAALARRSAEIFGQLVFDGDKAITAPDDLIRDLMPKTGVAFIGGQSRAGKTFIVIHMAYCLATGVSFFGKKVRERVGVAIMAGEGAGGITNRLEALKLDRGHSEKLPIVYLGNVPDLTNADERKALIQTLRRVDAHYRAKFGMRLGVVIYDTLAATFSLDDENDNSEASKTTRYLKELGTETQTLSVPVHHYGGTIQNGLRGASAWEGNCDAILSVLSDTDRVTGKTTKRELAIAKNRDGEAGPLSPFELRKIELGRDEDGAPFGTCVVDVLEGESTLGKNKPKVISRSEATFRDAFNEALITHGQDFEIPSGPTVRAVRLDMFRSEFFRRYASGETDHEKQAEAARKAFSRALEKHGAEFITVNRNLEAWVWKR